MSSTKQKQFLDYAAEAMVSARGADSDKEKKDLLDLARMWGRAAVQSESIFASAMTEASSRSENKKKSLGSMENKP